MAPPSSPVASIVLSVFTAEVRLNSLNCVKLLNHCMSLGKACPFLYGSLMGNRGSYSVRLKFASRAPLKNIM